MLGASLEQASHHVLANAIVEAGTERGLSLKMPEQVQGIHGVGLARRDRGTAGRARVRAT